MIPATESTADNETRVVLAMRWELVRRGIAGMLEEAAYSDMGVKPRVVGEAADADQLFDVVATCEPDVVIGRANLLGLEADEFVRRLEEARGGHVPVVILAREMEPDRVIQAWDAGIRGYLRSEIDRNTLMAALYAIRSGNLIICPEAEQVMQRQMSHRARPLPAIGTLVESLTTREQEVMELVAEGLSNKEIAFQMNIGRRTAEMHVSRLVDKFGMASRSELLVALLKG